MEARLLLGASLMALGRYAEARIEMLAARRKAPQVAAVHRLLGEAGLRLGKVGEARDALLRAAELDPGDEAVRGLLSELGDSEEPPPTETIERWFSAQDLARIEGLEELAELIGEPTRIGETSPGAVGEVAPPPKRVSVPPPPPPSPVMADEGRRVASAPLPATLETVPEEAVTVPLETVPGDELGKLDSDAEEELPGEPTQATVELSLSSVEVPGEEVTSEETELPAEPTRAMERPTGSLPATHTREASASSVPEATRRVGALPVRQRSRQPTLSFGVPPPVAGAASPALATPPPSPSTLSFPKGEDPLESEPTRAAPPPAAGTPSPALAAPPPSPSTPSFPKGEDPLESEPTRAAPPPAAGTPSPEGAVPSPHSKQETTARRYGPFQGGWVRLQEGFAAARRYLVSWRSGARARLASMERRRLVVFTLGAGALCVLLMGAWVWRVRSERRARWEIAERALATGLRLDVLDAVRRLERRRAPQAVALRAWGEVDFGGVAPAPDGDMEAPPAPWNTLSSAWRALEARHVGDAKREAAMLSRLAEALEGEREQAVLRAEASVIDLRAALLAGEVERAEASARAAARAWPEGVRGRMWWGLLAALRGAASEALTALGTSAGKDDHPGVRLVAAWVALKTGRVEGARGGANAVLSGLREQASRWQRRWAALLLAEVDLAQGDRAGAHEALRQAEEIGGPRSALAGVRLARGWLALGETKRAAEAIESLDAAMSLPGVAALRVRIALRAGRLGEARARLARVPEGAERDLLRAKLSWREGRLKQAARRFERVLSARPADPEALLALARLALERGDPDAAEAWLQKLPSSRSVPVVDVVALRAEAKILQHRPGEALRLLDDAVRGRRRAPRELRRLRGKALRALGRGLEAVQVLSTLAREAPGDEAVQVELAEAAMDSGSWRLAREALQRAAEQGRGGLRTALSRARFALMTWNTAEAGEALDRARSMGGSRSKRYQELSLRLKVLRGGGLDTARAIERAFQPRHRSPALWAALGWAYVHADDDASIRRAQRAFARALRERPDHLDALLGMAWAQVLSDRPADASRYIGEADRVVKGTQAGAVAEARLEAARARIDYHREDYESAEARIDQALRKDERSSEAWWVRALVADDRGRGEEVVEALDRALEGRLPRPVMWAARLLRSPRPAEACDWARAYLRAAPHGEDAREVEAFASQYCR